MKNILNQKGQMLIEILLAVLIAAIVIGAASSLGYVGLKSGQSSGAKSSAVALVQEGLEAMQAIAETDWHNIYLPPTGSGLSTDKGESFPYYVYKNGTSWAISTDVAKRDIIVSGETYSNTYLRTIYIYNVNRQKAGNDRKICSEKEIAESAAGCSVGEYIEDPSTQKIKVVVTRAGEAEVSVSEYLTRWKNNVSVQSDWSGGSGQTGPIATPNNRYDSIDPEGNIDTSGPGGSIKLKQ